MMKRCWQCSANLQEAAETCFHCGASAPKRGLGTLGVVMIVGLPLLAILAVGAGSSPSASKVDGFPDPWAAKAEGRENVEASARDAASVQYRNDFASGWVSDQGVKRTSYCGEINAKNGFGGYEGFTRFVTGPKGSPVVLERDTPSLFDGVWSKFCSRPLT
jgi:hypothetical protein